MTDLVSGRYPQLSGNWVYLGQQNNATQPDVPAFTNWSGVTPLEDGAPIITKEETIVPLAIPYGTSIEKISLVNGATETETLTHAWACVRSAPALAVGGEFKPVVQAKSKDITTFEAKKTETVSFTLEKSLTVTPEIAPFGFVYVGIFMEATKVGTYAAFKGPATALYKAESALKVFPWFANAPVAVKTKPTTKTEPEKEPKEAKAVEVIPLLVVQ